MPVHLRLDGLRELREALLNLPKTLRDEARPLVTEAADTAEAAIAAGYPHGTGNLARGLRQVVASSEGGVRVVLKNVSPHAQLFERGTELRHTSRGFNRGKMPAAPPGQSFVARVIRERRRMVEGLIGIVESQGLKVRGR
jgi:hypothetical protein